MIAFALLDKKDVQNRPLLLLQDLALLHFQTV
jgi:hypothetical protein